MLTTALDGGFADPVLNAATAFRAVMTAMARPGTIVTVTGAMPPAPLSPAAGAALLTLCDPETSVHLAGAHDTTDLHGWIAFHTGAPITDAAQAMFALGLWDALPLDALPLGTPEYPDRSATVIVEMDRLDAAGPTLRGPGIRDTATLSLPDVARFVSNARLFPRGLDFLFCCGDRLAALPRTTRVG